MHLDNREDFVLTDVQADPTTYYPTTRKTIRSITYFPSPFTKQERIPHLPFGGGWRSYKGECFISHARPLLMGTASASRPSISGERDPLAQDSKYRAYWLKQEQHKADVMRSSGICIVSTVRLRDDAVSGDADGYRSLKTGQRASSRRKWLRQ